MANKYTRKSKEPKVDEFVSFWTKLGEAILPYARPIAIGLGALIVVIVAAWVWDTVSEGGRQEATEQLGKALRIAEADLVTDENPVKPDDKDTTPRFKTEKERGEAVIAELDKLDKEHSGAVAKRAAMLRAGTLFDLGRFDDAESAYKKYVDSSSDDDQLRAIAREGVGLCEEAKGQNDAALNAFIDLEKSGGDFYRDRALYDQARVFAKKGDKAKAKQIYDDILKKTPTTPLKDQINAHLAMLDQ